VIWVKPLENTGEDGFGLPAAGFPNSSIRSSLPASDVPALSGAEPASPVPTYSTPARVNAMAPPLWTVPFGMPVRIAFGLSLAAMRITRLSVAVVT